MWIIAAAVIGFATDCLLGDPARLPHPVRLIGLWISVLEKLFRRLFPKTPTGERWAGVCMACSVLLLTGISSAAVLWLLFLLHFWVGFAACCIMCWQCLAAKCLKTEAMKVQHLLEKDDLSGARRQIAMLVGRDTEHLDAAQVTKAAVETVAENTADGVTAPLFWLLLGGPVAGLLYKAVNTMDSMVGYRNGRYLHFGRFAAKLDDAANYLPARLTALAMIFSAAILGYDGKNALRIWRRDRRKHASPNSAQTESVCAGALEIQLAGNASYFGKIHEKPFLGDPIRPIEPKDIRRSCRLMYGTGLLCLLVFVLLRLAAVLFLR